MAVGEANCQDGLQLHLMNRQAMESATVRDRKGTPKNFCDKVFFPNFQVNFLLRFPSKRLFYWYCPRIVQKILWYSSPDLLGLGFFFLAPETMRHNIKELCPISELCLISDGSLDISVRESTRDFCVEENDCRRHIILSGRSSVLLFFSTLARSMIRRT